MRSFVFLSMMMVSWAIGAAEIRLYTIDKFSRQDTVTLWGKGSKPGCHNFRKPKEIFRVAVIGKGACAIYAEPDCAPHSKIAAQWKNRKKPTTLLTPGSQWLFGEVEKVVDIKPEVDEAEETPATVKEIHTETPERPAGHDKAPVTRVEDQTGYDIVTTEAATRVSEKPRKEVLHLPLKVFVRSWQCVDRY